MTDKDQTNADEAAGAQEPAPNDAEVTRIPDPETAPVTGDGKGPVDPSNTYENGPQGQLYQPGVNYGAPEGATLISTYGEALEAGYFGYAPGAGNEQAMTAEAVAPRNQRMLEAAKASINAGTGEAAEGEQRSKRSTRK